MSSVAGATTCYTFAVSTRAMREATKKWAIKFKRRESADFKIGTNEWLRIYRVILIIKKTVFLNTSGADFITYISFHAYIDECVMDVFIFHIMKN